MELDSAVLGKHRLNIQVWFMTCVVLILVCHSSCDEPFAEVCLEDVLNDEELLGTP